MVNETPNAGVVTALVDAATVVTDASIGDQFTLTTTQNFTLANPTGAVDGQRLEYLIKQGVGGSHIITYDTKFRGSTDTALPLLTTAAGDVDILIFRYDAAVDFFDLLAYNKGYAS